MLEDTWFYDGDQSGYNIMRWESGKTSIAILAPQMNCLYTKLNVYLKLYT